MFKKKSTNDNLSEEQRRDRRKRGLISWCCTLIIGAVLTLSILDFSGELFFEEYGKDMVHGLEDTLNQYRDNLNMNELYYNSNHEVAENMAGYASSFLVNHGVNAQSMDILLENFGTSVSFYVFNGYLDYENNVAKGFFFKRGDRQGIEDYSQKELFDIISRGLAKCDDGYYIRSMQFSENGYVLMKYKFTPIFTEKSALEAYSDDSDEIICRVNEETGLIEDSSDLSFIGQNFADYSSDILNSNIQPYSISMGKDEEGKIALFAKSEAEGPDVFISVVPTEIFYPAIIRNALIGIMLCWLFLLIILFYVRRFVRNIYRDDKEVEFVHLFGKWCIDKHLLSHVGGLSLFGVALVIVSMLYVQTMTNYSTQNVKAKSDLRGLEQHIELNENNVEAMKRDYLECAGLLTEEISNYYVTFPEEISNESLDQFVKFMPKISRITLYNSEGVSEYDSRGVTGVALSKDTSIGEHRFWKVLSGESDYESYESAQEADMYYIAAMRQDSKGIIRICMSGDYYNNFLSRASIENYILTANMGSAERGYIDKDDIETLHWSVNSEPFKELSNELSDNVLTHGYSGMARISNKKQLVNVRDTKDRYLICGKSTSYLVATQNFTEYLFIALMMFLQYVVFVAISIREHSFVELDSTLSFTKVPRLEEIIRERTMDKGFRRIAGLMTLLTMFMIVAALLVDSVFGYTSILSYLFGSQWSKGVNLFSITMILILLVAVVIGGKLFEKIVLFFTSNMGPRGATIGRMLCSLIRFVALATVIIATLIDFGANPTALLTSAGIAGAMLSFCANQTINDLLSGFLIVFENVVNVGDWITVDGFRGEVTEIGVRTTKVSSGGDVKVVNNSDLRTFMIMCREFSGAYATVDIAYKEDAFRVLELLRDNIPYFREKIPQITEGPGFDGIVNLGDSGVTLRMWAHGHRDEVKLIERELLRITKELFDDNGIEIPFPQVTVHNADEE